MIYVTIDENNIVNGLKEIIGTIDAPDHIEVPSYDVDLMGKQLLDGNFSIPIEAEKTLEELQIDTRNKIHAKYQGIIDDINNSYSAYEVSTWRTQEQEWRDYYNDVNALTPFVDAIADSRDIDKGVLMSKIGLNVTFIAVTLGEQQKEEDGLKACTTTQEIYDYIFSISL